MRKKTDFSRTVWKDKPRGRSRTAGMDNPPRRSRPAGSEKPLLLRIPGEQPPVENGRRAENSGCGVLTCSLIRSRRRTLSVEIRPDGSVVVRAPQRLPASEIETFLRRKTPWILAHLPDPEETLPLYTEEELREIRRQAKEILPLRVHALAEQLGLSGRVRRVTIRFQKTRWGSCSAKGTISLNGLLVLVPERVRDYVIIHELCHLRHMDHSPAFWSGVEAVLPDHRELRGWLRKNGRQLIGRLPGSS